MENMQAIYCVFNIYTRFLVSICDAWVLSVNLAGFHPFTVFLCRACAIISCFFQQQQVSMAFTPLSRINRYGSGDVRWNCPLLINRACMWGKYTVLGSHQCSWVAHPSILYSMYGKPWLGCLQTWCLGKIPLFTLELSSYKCLLSSRYFSYS